MKLFFFIIQWILWLNVFHMNTATGLGPVKRQQNTSCFHVSFSSPVNWSVGEKHSFDVKKKWTETKPSHQNEKQFYLLAAVTLKVSWPSSWNPSWTCMWHQVHVPISHQEVGFSYSKMSLIRRSRGSSPATNIALSPLPPRLLLLLFLCRLSFPRLSSLQRCPVLWDGEFTSSAAGNWFSCIVTRSPSHRTPIVKVVTSRLHTTNKPRQNVSSDYCMLHEIILLYWYTITCIF